VKLVPGCSCFSASITSAVASTVVATGLAVRDLEGKKKKAGIGFDVSFSCGPRL
jgi:hypothetical protein